MKSKFLFVSFFLFSTIIYGQVGLGTYIWNAPVIMQECEINGQSLANKVLSISGQKFQVVSSNDTIAIISILKYKDEEGMKYQIYNVKNSSLKPMDGNNQRFFKVRNQIVQNNATKFIRYKASLVTGVLNYPVKLRLGDKFDFSGAFNIGTSVGLKLPYKSTNPFQHYTLIGTSISSINLDSSQVKFNSNLLNQTNNITAFSLSIGYMVEYEKIQIGVFLGFDWLNRQNQSTYEWRYQGVPWVSIGLGYGIFTDKNTEKDMKNEMNIDSKKDKKKE